MRCPICGKLLPPNTDRCPDCGFRCRTGTAQPRPDTKYYTPPNKTKRPRCCGCALAALLLMIALFVATIFGAANLIMEDVEIKIDGFDSFEDFPLPEEEPAPPPVEADEGCFTIRDGVVSFLPDRWDGQRILRVPETVDGETVTSIGPGCFHGCDGLTTIILPETIVSIEKDAFSGCSRLLGLYIPVGTTRIGPRAFSGCISMESVFIPDSVTQIASGAFDDCAALHFLFYDGDFASWNALYSDYINPFTIAICTDGDYYHGAVG